MSGLDGLGWPNPEDEPDMGACPALPSRIVQIVSMGFCAGPNNGDCHKLIALCADGSLWEQWHSMGYANVPTDGLWYPNHEPNGQALSREGAAETIDETINP